MGTLTSALSFSVAALEAEQGALNSTSNNVANVNTPGYSRQIPIFSESDPVVIGALTFGTGVRLQALQSLRDPILQKRIQEETQQQSQLDASVSALRQLEVNFTNSDGDIGTKISKLFTSLNQLSSDPSNISLRQGVLQAANNLATTFNNTARSLGEQRVSLDQSVIADVQRVNTLTAQIAKLNGQISSLENVKQGASAFIDQRDQLTSQLSELIDVTSIRTETGITLTTSNGTALVASTHNFALSAQTDITSNTQHVYTADGVDITASIAAGQLGGIIQVRDQSIVNTLNQLDSLAFGLANALNTANSTGSDLNGTTGGNIFTPPAASGAALNLAVQITDPKLIAASSDGSAGSNGNLNVLLAVHDQSIVAGQSANNYYSQIVATVGNEVANGADELSSAQSILQQLQDQRASVSGVSLNEEAANLVRFQNAYNAAARVVTTISQLLDTVIKMGT
jgi:flagellar hook-associated protein 1 FlgK